MSHPISKQPDANGANTRSTDQSSKASASGNKVVPSATHHWFSHKVHSTIGGGIAILLWGMTVALVRSLSEQLGPLTAAAAVYSISGGWAVTRLLTTSRRQRQYPRKYLICCGALFVSYMVELFLAIGLARNRQQVLEVGLLNYLWPALTILLSLLLLNKRANILLLPGTLLALAGIFLVLTQGSSPSWQSFSTNVESNSIPYLLGLAAALSWALYSTLTRKWAGDNNPSAVDIFLPVTAVVLILICLVVDEPRAWSLRTISETICLGATTYLAYRLWDSAMRKGQVVLVAAASYLTPLFSTAVSSVYLAIEIRSSLWVGCGLLIAGSLLSWLSVSEGQPQDQLPGHHAD